MPEATPDGNITVIRGGTVLPFDGSDRVIENGEVWFEGGEIRAVCEAGGFDAPPGAGVTAVEAGGRIVMPGLINAHSHSYTALLKGTVDAVPLDLYMIRAIAGGSDRTPREVFVSAQVDCITLLKSGVTSVIDHYSERPQTTAEGLEAVAAGYREAGLRARIAPMFADLPYLDTVPMDEGPPARRPARLLRGDEPARRAGLFRYDRSGAEGSGYRIGPDRAAARESTGRSVAATR